MKSTKRNLRSNSISIRILTFLCLLLASVNAWAQQWTDNTTGVTFTPVEGSSSTTTGEGYESACDGDVYTKMAVSYFATNYSQGAYVVVEASSPIVLTGYTITTANDNTSYTGRNPQSWTIQGCNTQNGTYETIVTVTNDNVLQDVNYTEYSFTCSPTRAYKYFKFTVTAHENPNNSWDVMQFAEFHPLGLVPEGLESSVRDGYVMFSGSNYLDNSTAGTTTFNPSTCIWRGTSGGPFTNGTNYIRNGQNIIGTGNNRNCTLGGTESGTTGQTLYTNYYYLRYDSDWTRTTSTTNGGRNVVFAVTKDTYREISTAPTISGADVFDAIGNKTYSRTNASFTQGYIDYIFYNNTDHYFKTDNSTSLNAKPTAESFTYTWSLSANAADHATVDATSGVVTYSTYYDDDEEVTLTLTATSANTNKTFSVDKVILMKKGACTTPTISFDHSTKTASILGKAGETILYKTDDSYNNTGAYATYTAPIAISGRTRVWAKATKAGIEDSEETSVIIDNPNNVVPSNNSIGNVNIGTTYSLPYTLNGPTGGEIIYDKVVYSSDAPTIASVDQNGLITVNGQGSAHIILTGYKLDGTALSDVSVEIVGVRQEYVDGKKCIYALSEIPNNSNGSFILMIDITVPETGNTSITGFTGSFDGNFKTISGLTQPLFGTITNANVYNVIVDKVNISVNGDAGAIAAQATENSRIYNCGVLSTGSKFEFDKPVSGNTSKVTSSASGMSVGGIVGAIFNNTRVANCFSYADVSATGGNYPHASGIVGWADNWVDNDNYVTNGTNCFVVNCMFYGNLTGGQRSPIVFVNGYNGNYTTWNYFRYKSIPNVTGLNQNGALAAQEDMWLKRFKFYQSAVTNHRDLAAVYIFNDASRIDDIAQWYIDETIAPWPILRKAGPQKSILERTIPNTGKANEGNLITNGKKLVDEAGNILDNDVTQRYNMNVGTKGKLHVNFNISGTGVASGGQTYSVDLPITDMDFEHYDYTWGKVVLPFANEFDGWTPNYEYICTGWEISSVTGGTQGTLTDYNFADRNCTAKDIYHATNNPIIFAQGGNWIVPYGVTSINVKAHFAKAYYLADANYDCQGKGSNGIGGTRPTTYHGRTVYTSVANAWNAMGDRTLPHDQALVLVGNYHYNSNQSGNYTGKGCTIMSIDEDNDQQPDFGWYNSNGNYRANWMPMRWDFIALYGFNMVQTNTAPPGIAIPKTVGWLEFTETTICRTYEFESNDGVRSGNDDSHSRNAWIINGGYYQQMVRCFESGNANKLSYMKVGGNAYIKEFFHGNHSKTTLKFTLRPIIVTGGEIAQCFLTGMGNKNEITATNNNVRFYCAGGKIDKYLSVYNGYPVVDATMKVDHARIGRFFGGGTSPKAQLSGDINITMDYSHVDFFCGGPEFGDMGNGKTVTVSTTGSIFGEYYGAGFGGTALTRITNGDGQKTPFSVSGRGRLNYNAGEGGFEVSYEMEALLNGSGGSLWRYYDYRADLSMASTGNVKTTAKDCLFLSYFYGGGCQGKVNGTINSTLNNCVVIVSAFGGGYKAAATTIDVYPTGGNTWQVWDETYKAYSDPIYPTPEEFVWKHGNSNTSNDNTNILYTTADMTQMGRVTGEIKITVNGGTVGENVFGGGNESPSDNKTNVTITGDALIEGDVYGGGNAAPVAQSTNVIIVGTDAESPVEINGSVFGGGLGEPATVGNNTKVHLQDKVNVTNNVYGGGNGAEVKGNTEVIIGE